MPVDLEKAACFIAGHARLLDRHRHAALIQDGAQEPVLAALRAYRNDDGGFGHALEPDLRAPTSQPGATLYALEMLAELDAFGDPLAAGAIEWIPTIADEDGGIPAVAGDVDRWPHAPWWQAEPGSFLTAALVAVLHEGGVDTEWRDRATAWTWEQIGTSAFDSPYRWHYFVSFLDQVDDGERAQAELARIREPLQPLVKDEHTPLAYSPWPSLRSRALFTADQIERALDELESGQAQDGGWTFPWPQWSPGATLDWRGSVTIRALQLLKANGRL